MRQKDIVDEIRKLCGHAELLPAMGWHFMYNRQHYFYLTRRNEGMMRFCVPHLVKEDDYDKELLAEAINDTNRNVKFIKAVRLDGGSVSLDYDHKTSAEETAANIVPHIVRTLDFASTYLLHKLKNR